MFPDIISCAETGNRIRQTVDHVVDSRMCDFKDLVTIQHNFPTLHLNQKMLYLQHNAETFFQDMDSATISSVNSQSVLHNYKAMLDHWQRKEFKNRDALVSFLRAEDYHYRSFLSHLNEYSSHDMAIIIQSTESLLSQVASDTRRYSLDWAEVVTYMSVRTNRRLIQNADTCLSGLSYSSMQNDRQAAMTLPMLLHPYTNLNQFTLGMRTPGQYAQLMDMGDKISIAINSQQCKQFIPASRFDSLPNKLIKEYIAFVMNH